MAPFTDADIYGENYEPSQEELDARAASIAAYLEAEENKGVIGSIESLYAIHMIELTGDRLIELEANTSKLEIVFEDCGNAVVPGTESKYTADSLEQYKNAEAFATEVLNDAYAVPSMVNTATTELVYAWKHLEECADYSKLDAAIAAAQDTVNENGLDAEAQSNYTVDSYKAFADAYIAATEVDRDLGASDNEYLEELAANLERTFGALEAAAAGDPVFEMSQDATFADPTWTYYSAPYLDEDSVMNLGMVETADGYTVDGFLILGNGIFSDAEISDKLAGNFAVSATKFAAANGAWNDDTLNCRWWVRPAATEEEPAATAYASIDGIVAVEASYDMVGVRPAFSAKLK